jgi:hypothetical protein
MHTWEVKEASFKRLCTSPFQIHDGKGKTVETKMLVVAKDSG